MLDQQLHRRVFEPFGKVIAQTASPPRATDQLYTGQRYQEATKVDDRVANPVAGWHARGLGIRPGASERDLSRFQHENRVILPADLRAFLAAVGMEEEEVDPDTQIRFWSLSEIRSAAEELRGEIDDPERLEEFFVFADYSLWAHAYAIHLSASPDETSPVVIVGGDALVQVATSSSHFLERYMEDPKQLF